MTATTRAPRTLWGLSITRALGLLLIPLVIVGMMLWGLWKPTERMNTVQAAVVNLDEPVEVDGQLTPLGRVLAAELIGDDSGQNFEWVLTDETDASEGLFSGRYITVVTIPENFSAAATSMSEGPGDAVQARIDVTTSERAKLLDAALATAVTETATRIINDQLGSAVVTNVVVGMSTLGDGIDQVSDGADQLAEGVEELSTGLGEFATGTESLAGGIAELSAGTGQLAHGMRTYASGVDEFATGAGQAASGSHQLAGGVQQYTETINSMLLPLHDALASQTDNLAQLRELLELEDLPITPEQRAEMFAIIDQVIEAPAGINQLIGGGDDLAAGALAQAQGLDELASGAYGLAQGAHDIASGAGDLAYGTSQLAGEMPGLVDGAHQLADGARQTSSGTGELAEGIGQIAAEIPRYSDEEAERFAELALNPVASDADDTSLFSGSGAPLFLTIALWAGALATFLLLAPLWSRTREAAKSEAWITLRSGATSVIIGGLQGLIAGGFVAAMLAEGTLAAVSFAAFGALAGVAFGLVNQGLVALLRGPGRFVSFVLLIMALVAGIVSTAPGLLASIIRFTPIGTAMTGVQEIIEQGVPAIGTITLTILWAGLGVLLIGAAVNRARKEI